MISAPCFQCRRLVVLKEDHVRRSRLDRAMAYQADAYPCPKCRKEPQDGRCKECGLIFCPFCGVAPSPASGYCQHFVLVSDRLTLPTATRPIDPRRTWSRRQIADTFGNLRSALSAYEGDLYQPPKSLDDRFFRLILSPVKEVNARRSLFGSDQVTLFSPDGAGARREVAAIVDALHAAFRRLDELEPKRYKPVRCRECGDGFVRRRVGFNRSCCDECWGIHCPFCWKSDVEGCVHLLGVVLEDCVAHSVLESIELPTLPNVLVERAWSKRQLDRMLGKYATFLPAYDEVDQRSRCADEGLLLEMVLKRVHPVRRIRWEGSHFSAKDYFTPAPIDVRARVIHLIGSFSAVLDEVNANYCEL